MSAIAQGLVFLLAALVMVPLGRRLGLSSVLGYLAAGIAIGPSGLDVAGDASATLHFAELGVVLLLFIIGLELQPRRLWVMRRLVFGLGTAQVAAVTAAIGATAWLLLEFTPTQAVLLGFALSLSSTAFVLQLLAERKELNAAHGRAAFGVLLLQDLAVIPAIAVLVLLAPQPASAGDGPSLLWGPLFLMLGLTAARLLLRPALRIIAGTGIHELFTAAALAMVLGAAIATEQLGLSIGLGAFLAGMLVADSEYRHQLETDLTPFKGLLLGLFFMAVGMSVDLALLLREPLAMLGLAAALMLLKTAVLLPLGRLAGLGWRASARLSVTLSQGGEFAFVLLGAGVTAQLLGVDDAARCILVVTLSMALTPLAIGAVERLLARRTEAPRAFDTIADHDHPVLLLGFGRVAQIVGRVLTMRGIPFTALDGSPTQIDFVRAFGNDVFYGDPTRLDLLRTAQVEKARVVLIAVDEPDAALRIATMLREHFPDVRICARARDRYHALQLREVGVHQVVRETLHSSLELARTVLEELDVDPVEAARSVRTFRDHDARTLERQAAVFHDEAAYRQAAMDSALELQQLFAEDAAQRAAEAELRDQPADGPPAGDADDATPPGTDALPSR